MNKVVIIGYVYKSQQNGAVYDVGGIPVPLLRMPLWSRTEDNGDDL